DSQAFAFDFIPKIFTINTPDGTDSWTGVSVSDDGGVAIHGAALQPQQVEPASIAEPSGFLLFLVGVGVPAGALILLRRRKLATSGDCLPEVVQKPNFPPQTPGSLCLPCGEQRPDPRR